MPVSETRQSLLARFREHQRTIGVAQRQQVPKRPPGTDVEASEQQQLIWVHAHLARNLPLYNEPVTIRIPHLVDPVVFERAFNHVLRRHEGWRTAFDWREETLWQVVTPDLRVRIPFEDLRRGRAAERERIALSRAIEDVRRPFNLANAPLLRARLIALADDDFRLCLTLHHIIFDGVSLYTLFLPELQACYAAFVSGREPDLGPPPVQYPDLTAWLRTQHRDFRTELRYWDTKLAGELPEMKLPLDRPRPDTRAYTGGAKTFYVSSPTLEKLKNIGRERDATAHQTFLAAFHVLLYRYTGQVDQIVGGVSSSRKHQNAERVIGYLLNTIVLRTKLDANDSFFDLVSKTRDTALDALSHEVPFQLLVSRFGKNRTPGVTPIFQVLYSVEPPRLTVAEGWRITEMDIERPTANFDLTLQVDVGDDAHGQFLYATDVFNASTIDKLIDSWIKLLDLIAARPELSVASLAAALDERTGSRRRQIWNRIFRRRG